MMENIVFFGVVALTLLGAFLAVSLRNVFYNALALVLCLFGVACLFIFLNSEFLAVMEVIVYIGAISIAIIFAIMLSTPMLQKTEAPQDRLKTLRSFVIAALLFGGLFKALQKTTWPAAGVDGDYSLHAIGRLLLTGQVLPFEAVSLVLLVAIMGALLLAEKK
ncbi:MAG: NADH-quinone oxidoreductase subunit J [Candidatus Omnitrophica bacterium]|nr:NADH-quinone oxidoreductase subunit J [Candidatus Omnitrophota bacterium]